MKRIKVPVLHTQPTRATDDVPATYKSVARQLGYDPLDLTKPRKRGWLQRLLTWVR